MSPEEVLAHLPPESDDELTLADDLPASPLDAFRPLRLPCPESWARLAPRFLGMSAGDEVDAWCLGGLLFARAEAPTAFGRIGFLRLPLRPDDVEAAARLPGVAAPPERATLAVAALLGRAPILSQREAEALVEPSRLALAAHRRLLEDWSAPRVSEDELVFFATSPGGGPIERVRANLATRWIDLEPLGLQWEPRPPADAPKVDARDFGDTTEPLDPAEDETGDFGDATEPLDARQLHAALPTVRAPIPDLSDEEP